MNTQLVSPHDFINKLTGGKITPNQLNRAVAYLRAKGIGFYDNWSKDFSAPIDTLRDRKADVLNALRASLK